VGRCVHRSLPMRASMLVFPTCGPARRPQDGTVSVSSTTSSVISDIAHRGALAVVSASIGVDTPSFRPRKPSPVTLCSGPATWVSTPGMVCISRRGTRRWERRNVQFGAIRCTCEWLADSVRG
jgi:hypothetical protein